MAPIAIGKAYRLNNAITPVMRVIPACAWIYCTGFAGKILEHVVVGFEPSMGANPKALYRACDLSHLIGNQSASVSRVWRRVRQVLCLQVANLFADLQSAANRLALVGPQQAVEPLSLKVAK